MLTAPDRVQLSGSQVYPGEAGDEQRNVVVAAISGHASSGMESKIHFIVSLGPEKVRRGARITRRYDAAQTPYRRLLAAGVLPRKTERQLSVRWAAVDPLRLKLELESAQRTLAQRSVQPVVAHPLRSEEFP